MDLNSYNLLSRDELVAQFKLIGGRANKRLERLEKAGMTTTSAYKHGTKAAARTGGNKRFSLSVRGLTTRQIKARMNTVNEFMNDVTSTPGGARKVAQKIGGTVKARYGLDLGSAEDIKAVFEGALYKKLEAKFDPYMAMYILAEVQKSDGDVKKILEGLRDTFSKNNVFMSEKEFRSLSGTLGSWKRWHGLSLYNDSEAGE